MKFMILALALCLGSSAFAQVTTLNDLTGPTAPTVDKMTAGQLSGHLGKNLVRLVAACTVSSWSLALSAVTETIPVVSAATSVATELKLGGNSGGSAEAEFNMNRDKDLGHYIGGGALSFATDLAQIGYYFVFDDHGRSLERALELPNTKKGFSATTALAKRFYGDTENGECAKAGREIVDVLNVIQTSRR